MIRSLILLLLLASPALAQVESREGIALQNQILQLRQEMEILRRGGAGGGSLPPPSVMAPVPRSGAAVPGGEMLSTLLDRVTTLEEETRRLRGRAEEAEFANRSLTEQVTKLQGDLDYRLQALESGGRPGSPPPAAAPIVRPAPAGAPGLPPPAAAPSRPPERALQEGQTALGRRDYAAAETAAREVLAGNPGARAQDAGMLLGDALVGKRDYQNAALAYDEAYRRNQRSSRAPEALLGLATAFNGFGAKREACATLDQLRSDFPRVATAMADRVTVIRQRSQCR
ncbi:YbgF trimerization domain-containing protein [Humitalea rosea]|nr:YbgF trimerization domain-containing protein [Humitalea rosea]